ncbi:hypothetical protein HPB51_001701 [Rhipicephalus microplus]|uniref:HAT C-terminal dimerisation domain-containing protein n=1 Tax=Rhipicephalus microplus TaxID=6941 RepID=A0A9J6E523_RHIMP|nr:hypothetical protein HPB51_001701 [Rhipicephalus microplus]
MVLGRQTPTIHVSPQLKKGHRHPWYDRELMQQMRRKDRAYHKWKRHPCYDNWEAFKATKRVYLRMLKRKRAAYAQVNKAQEDSLATSQAAGADSSLPVDNHVMVPMLPLDEAVSVELATSNCSIDGLCSAEWKEALEYLDALKPLYDATVITSADKYPSLSTQIPIIFAMLSCLSNFSGKTGFHKELARSLNTRFHLYTEDKETCLAMVLDPRFKSTVFRNNKQKLVWLKDLVFQDVALCFAVEVVQPAAKVQEPQQCVQPSSDVWSALDNLANSQVASTPLSTSEWEIKAYSEEALLKKDSDPCDWWRTVGTFRYPSLAKLCPKYLPIPATSVPSARAFSVVGEVVSVRRERLLPDHVEQLIFLHDNM